MGSTRDWGIPALLAATGCTFGGAGSGVDTVDTIASGTAATGSDTATAGIGPTTTAGPDDTSPTATGLDGTPGEESAGSTGLGETGATAGCGNGIVDAEEACDDGNRIDADGCTNLCRISGAQIWSLCPDGPAGALHGVVHHPEQEAYYAVGSRQGEDGTEAYALQLSPDGRLLNEATDAAGGPASSRALALQPDGQLAVAQLRAVGSVVLRLDPQVNDVETLDVLGASGLYSEPWGVAVAPDGRTMLAGWASTGNGSAATMALLSADWLNVSYHEHEGTPQSEWFRDVVFATGPNAFFGLYDTAAGNLPARIFRFDGGLSEPADLEIADLDEARWRALAVSDDTVVVVGFTSAGADDTAQIVAYDLARATLRWQREGLGGADDSSQLVAAASDGAGDFIVGGFVTAPDAKGELVVRPLVMKVSAEDGTQRWRTIVELEADKPAGIVNAIAVGSDNRLAIVGAAGTPDEDWSPFAALLEP